MSENSKTKWNQTWVHHKSYSLKYWENSKNIAIKVGKAKVQPTFSLLIYSVALFWKPWHGISHWLFPHNFHIKYVQFASKQIIFFSSYKALEAQPALWNASQVCSFLWIITS